MNLMGLMTDSLKCGSLLSLTYVGVYLIFAGLLLLLSRVHFFLFCPFANRNMLIIMLLSSERTEKSVDTDLK